MATGAAALRWLGWLPRVRALAEGGAAPVLVTPEGEAGAARRLAVAGAVGELAAGTLMRRRLGDLAEPYEQGDAAVYTVKPQRERLDRDEGLRTGT